MDIIKIRQKRAGRQQRVRKAVRGNDERPRLHVFRSSRFVYAQIINDAAGKTLVAASEKEAGLKTGATKTARAIAVGTLLAEKAVKAKVTKVRFDRGAYKYHGRVKALAEAAREHGLEF